MAEYNLAKLYIRRIKYPCYLVFPNDALVVLDSLRMYILMLPNGYDTSECVLK